MDLNFFFFFLVTIGTGRFCIFRLIPRQEAARRTKRSLDGFPTGMSQAGPTQPPAPKAAPVESPEAPHPGVHRGHADDSPSGGNDQFVTALSCSAVPRKHSPGSPGREGGSRRSRLHPSGKLHLRRRRDQREWRLLTLPNPRSRRNNSPMREGSVLRQRGPSSSSGDIGDRGSQHSSSADG